MVGHAGHHVMCGSAGHHEAFGEAATAAADHVHAAEQGGGGGGGGGERRRCLCSPTSHPGSFRCRQQCYCQPFLERLPLYY